MQNSSIAGLVLPKFGLPMYTFNFGQQKFQKKFSTQQLVVIFSKILKYVLTFSLV
jgi:hypothetical protein